MEESDDIHAALALMYGYAAKYAPSTVIEARIDALVVQWNHCFIILLIYFVSIVVKSIYECGQPGSVSMCLLFFSIT